MKAALSFLLLPALATACTEATEPPVLDPVQAIAVQERLVEAYTAFGLRLFREVAGNAGQGNVFLSPSSVALALSMTFNGAAGETREGMSRALQLDGLSIEAVNAANLRWSEALARPGPDVELSVANSIWAREGTPFKEAFLQRTRDAYNARIEALDFADPSASRTINDWVSRSTRGKIEEIVPASLDPQTVMYLINAIYFKGKWTKPFDPAQTRERPWHLPGGGSRAHPMMVRDGSYPVLDADGFTAVGLPYGEGRVRMYIFLPDEGSSLATLRGDLEPERWEGWMESFQERRILFAMPRFRLENEVKLVDALSSLGMATAFDPARADFEGMLPREYLDRENAYITDVKHKTFLEVTEWGTEAAGVTSVEMGVTSMPPSVVVDRPFLVAIRDEETGTVLFLGQITDP